MYIPTAFREGNKETLLGFMRANSFAIVVSVIDGVPFATHIPVSIEERGDAVVLTGHVAKANPHARAFAPESDTQSLIIFSGPHAYVSPTAYEARESVPTWNYIAVHAVGVMRGVRFAESPESVNAMLDEMIKQYDAEYLAQWQSLPDKYRSGMMHGVVGFEMPVAQLDGKFKLSQNRSAHDQATVMAMLAESDDAAAKAVGEAMRLRPA
ncbi:MAG: FMN-binding negative transcriptional regulator [Phycisphaerae bacterium]|nr:FMN-binding negative transcriptional regulator [Gemmatimonadaceae bacterium]